MVGVFVLFGAAATWLDVWIIAQKSRDADVPIKGANEWLHQAQNGIFCLHMETVQ